MTQRNSEQNSFLRKLSIFILCLIILPSGFLYLSHLQSLESFYTPLEKKYKQSNIRERCKREGYSILLLCFKSDFYAALRQGDSYSAINLQSLKEYLYKVDKVSATTLEQKFQIELEYLDMTYQFLSLTNKVSYDRTKIQIGSIILARYFKKNILLKLKEIPQKIEFLDSMKDTNNTIDEVDLARFERLKLIYQDSVFPRVNWEDIEF